MTKQLLFDWGNTIMIDFEFPGPMYTWEKVSWVPGAENALVDLSGRYDLFLATNAGLSGTTEVIRALQRVGAEKYFKQVFTAIEIGYEKPDIRFFSAIIEKLGAVPSELVMIGDNYEKDIRGAKNAGLKTVFFNPKGRTGNFEDADAVIGEMKELVPLMEEL
jgi:HAD superfamily hydrolase (TIGR01662 family)